MSEPETSPKQPAARPAASAPHLILIHGYPLDHAMWRPVAALLPDVVVHAPDLRWCSGVLSLGAPASIDVLADDIVALMDKEGIDRAWIAGMSMGGYVALSLAERHRSRLLGIGLINTHASADTPQNRAARQAMIDTVKREGPAAAADAMMTKLFARRTSEWDGYVREAATAAGAEGICWALEAMMKRPDRNHVLGAINVPTLVIHGDEDALIPVQKARDVTKCLLFGRLEIIPGTGHCSPLENPNAVADAMRHWMGL